MIKPTVGRVVWFTPSKGPVAQGGFAHYSDEQPHAAMIVYVWNDGLVNLVVHDHAGISHSKTSVPLVQENEPHPENGYFAQWMPFQVGQAKAHGDAAAAASSKAAAAA